MSPTLMTRTDPSSVLQPGAVSRGPGGQGVVVGG